jgi:hypothetical protein
MKRNALLIAITMLAAPALYAADAKTQTTIDSAGAFARLKTLAGDWEAKTDSMGTVRLNYELIAGGTALVERESSEHMPVMLTVYHFDGNRLMLTHYCAAGNQPRMQAAAYDPSTGLVKFRFLDATNLSSPGAGHMHNADIRVLDNTHLQAAWQFYENGQLKMTESAEYTRVR